MEISFKIIRKMMHSGGGLIHKTTNETYLIINPYSKEEKVMHVTENSFDWPEPFPENIEDYIRIPSLFHGFVAKEFLIRYKEEYDALIQSQRLGQYLTDQYPPFISHQYPEEIYERGTEVASAVLAMAEENANLKKSLEKYEEECSDALIFDWCSKQGITLTDET